MVSRKKATHREQVNAVQFQPDRKMPSLKQRAATNESGQRSQKATAISQQMLADRRSSESL